MHFDIRREMRMYGRGTDIAEKLGLSRQYVSAVYNLKKPPSDALLSLLGWERVTTVTYHRKAKRK